jgi:hypothetical protein
MLQSQNLYRLWVAWSILREPAERLVIPCAVSTGILRTCYTTGECKCESRTNTHGAGENARSRWFHSRLPNTHTHFLSHSQHASRTHTREIDRWICTWQVRARKSICADLHSADLWIRQKWHYRIARLLITHLTTTLLFSLSANECDLHSNPPFPIHLSFGVGKKVSAPLSACLSS